jgi:alpha-D-ribose 1-methylphosphonate 5-triphosphate synthase subunit PhnH
MPSRSADSSIWEAAFQQRAYRDVLRSFAFPGTVVALERAKERTSAYVAALSTLVDHSVTLADVDGVIDSATLRSLGVRIARAGTADFVLARAAQRPPLGFQMRIGEIERPDDGATLLLVGVAIDAASATAPASMEIAGPGVHVARAVSLVGFHPAWVQWRNECVHYPLGVDLILTAGNAICSIPRTASVHIPEDAAWVM